MTSRINEVDYAGPRYSEQGRAGTEKPISAAEEVMCTLQRVASLSIGTAERVADEISLVCVGGSIDGSIDKSAVVGSESVRTFAPLFNEQREFLETIETNLKRINRVLDRLDL